jgi:alpha-1,3-glucosyltransferase
MTTTVHEKSVLLPLLPASLLALEEPFLFKWLTINSMLSMYPLLRRDGLTICYIALLLLFILLYYAPVISEDGSRSNYIAQRFPRFWRVLMSFYALFSVTLHVLYLFLQPPKRYPFIFEAVITAFAFSQFAILAIYTNSKQWRLPLDTANSSVVKEKIN